MTFYVYILYSVAIDQYYIGHTSNLSDRLFRHMNSGSKSTKKANDWKLVYKEEFSQGLKLIDGKWKLKIKKAENILSH